MAPTANAKSRTMQLAVSGIKVPASPRDDSGTLQRQGTWFSAQVAAAPRTKVEQYWATRALVAETLLSVHDRHQTELAVVRQTEEQKREREIGAILHATHQRQTRLERLMVSINPVPMPVVCLAVFLGFVAWLVMRITPAKSTGTSHFTIPILSPFTSVVEHETGVIGSRAIVVLVVIVGIAVYVAVRRRLSRR